MEKKIVRYCRHCRAFKPLRTHHCSICRRCVLKMDHHDKWFFNCVGFHNYKYYMNILIYLDLFLFLVIATFWKCLIDVQFNPSSDGFTFFFVVAYYVIDLLIFFPLFAFTCFHFRLIFLGKTTLEYCEKSRNKKKKEYSFDEGIRKNFIAVFNANPLLWFFPVNKNEEGYGFFENYQNKIQELFEKE